MLLLTSLDITLFMTALSQQPQPYSPEHLFLGSALSAGSSALTAGIFTAINPLGGAIFGITSFLGGRLISWIYDKTGIHPQNNIVSKSIATQISELNSGLWYINVHSANFPGGDVRAQITSVPEPQQYALVAGLALAGFAAWRKRQTTVA